MQPRRVRPLLLSSRRDEGGQLLVRARLADGRVVEAILPEGEATEQLLAELDPVLRTRLLAPGERLD